MEEAPENGKESPHSAHANGMNEWISMTFTVNSVQMGKEESKSNFFSIVSKIWEPVFSETSSVFFLYEVLDYVHFVTLCPWWAVAYVGLKLYQIPEWLNSVCYCLQASYINVLFHT